MARAICCGKRRRATLKGENKMIKELSKFVCESSNVRNEKDIMALYQNNEKLFHDMEWNVTSPQDLRKQLSDLRVKASSAVIYARVQSGEIEAKPSRERGVHGNFIGSVIDADGNVAETTESKTERGKTTTSIVRLTSGFDSYQKAQKWVLNKLAACADNFTGMVESDSLPIKATFSHKQAIASHKKK